MPDSLTIASGLFVLAAVYLTNWFTSGNHTLSKIPTVGGPSLPILSWYGAFQMLKRGPAVLEEAYGKYKGTTFKFAEMKGWHVVVSGPRLVDELTRAPEDVLSMTEATRVSLQIPYTMGNRTADNGYHIAVVRTQFTRSLERIYPDLYDEIVSAFNDQVVLTGDEWTAVPAMTTATQIVSRTSNRAFVGLPVCRDPDYCALTQDFAISVVKCSQTVNLFPVPLQPIVGRLTSTLEKSIARGAKHLGPIIEERLRLQEEYKDGWSDKPVDFLQALIDAAPPEEMSAAALTSRVLVVNFAAIHTSSISFTQALYRLAATPTQYLYPLRAEVDAVVAEHGWTKAALQKMRKLDSFLKESQRMASMGALLSSRRALREYTFSDGTRVPAGTYISAPVHAIHCDPAIYPRADAFDAWRFADMREGNGAGTKHQFVSTNVDYMPFGHGRHACPGRFFAASELKTMLAHVVHAYDVKMENEGVLPRTYTFGSALIPDMKARVMFRKRQA